MHQQVDASNSRWLAATFGCCAPPSPNYQEFGSRNHGQDATPVFEQPRMTVQSSPQPQLQRPPTSHSITSNVSQWISTGRDTITRASTRASILRRPWTNHSQMMPTIDDDTVSLCLSPEPPPRRQRRSFRPLQLSIYLPEGRLSLLPDFENIEWSDELEGLAFPAPAVLRDRPSLVASTVVCAEPKSLRASVAESVGSPDACVSSRMSKASSIGITLPASAIQHIVEIVETPPASAPITSPILPIILQRASTTKSLKLEVPSSASSSRSPSPNRARSNTEPANIRKHRSGLRSPRSKVDEAIMELNTIVEERRTHAHKLSNSDMPPPSPSSHVPAIAPFRRLHVRSETLNDIGSAFSSPLVSKPLPATPTERRSPVDWRRFKSSSSSPQSIHSNWSQSPTSSCASSPTLSRPQTSSSFFPFTSRKNSRASAKPKLSISTWLRLRKQRSTTSLQPFYQCQAATIPPATPAKDVPARASSDTVELHELRTSTSTASITLASARTSTSSTLSSTPPTLLNSPLSRADTGLTSASSTVPPTPVTSRSRSMSVKSKASTKSFGKWKGESLNLMAPMPLPLPVIIADVDSARSSALCSSAGLEEMEREMEMGGGKGGLRVGMNPLRMNPKSPVGVAF